MYFFVHSKFRKIVDGFWMVPFLLIIRLIWPFKKIKIYQFPSDRIGEYIPASIKFVYSKKTAKEKIICVNKEIVSNVYWHKKIETLSEIWFMDKPNLWWWNLKLPRSKFHIFSPILENTNPTLYVTPDDEFLSFSSVEHQIARSNLVKLGWKEGDKIVCLLVRDSKYLNEIYPKNDWLYHDYRNSDIGDYAVAIDFLLKQNVWVFRMGRHTEEKLSIKNKRYIEYQDSGIESDFMDIWLFANANGCISNSSGIDWISVLYRKPQLFINYLPMVHILYRSTALIYPKKLIWVKSGIELTLREYLAHEFFHSEKYRESNIVVVNLTKEELLDGFIEFYQRYLKTNELIFSVNHLESRFWYVIKSYYLFFSQSKTIFPSYNYGFHAIPSMCWLNGRNSVFFE